MLAVSALATYADADGVVACYVATLHGDGATVVEVTIAAHVEVVSGHIAEDGVLVRGDQVLDREVL